MGEFMRVEDLEVYRLLCDLHVEVCSVTKTWPREERFELTSQVRRCSNSAPAQLAEKNLDRHVRNRVEGVNRSRGEALETVHHMFIAKRKGYIDESTYDRFHNRYHECVRMLNGLERSLERQLPPEQRKFSDSQPRTLNSEL
jgi:four helix bundle protein